VTRVDHVAVIGTCFSCHNGTIALGKPPTHLPTGNVCDDCHVTAAWTSVRFDHSGITSPCSTCHNGSTATGKSATHIATSAQCDVCHTTTAWVPANFDHSVVTGSCSSCHNGVNATGKSGGHFVTSLQCDTCHDTIRWTPINFRHTSGNYPGDHRSNVVCLSCHTGNSQTIAWPNAAYKPDCAGCHAGDYRAEKHKKVDSPRVLYTVSELRDCTGSCHVYTDNTLTTIEKTRNSEHRVSDGGF
jgi:hypothetical protein